MVFTGPRGEKTRKNERSRERERGRRCLPIPGTVRTSRGGRRTMRDLTAPYSPTGLFAEVDATLPGDLSRDINAILTVTLSNPRSFLQPRRTVRCSPSSERAKLSLSLWWSLRGASASMLKESVSFDLRSLSRSHGRFVADDTERLPEKLGDALVATRNVPRPSGKLLSLLSIDDVSSRFLSYFTFIVFFRNLL